MEEIIITDYERVKRICQENKLFFLSLFKREREICKMLSLIWNTLPEQARCAFEYRAKLERNKLRSNRLVSGRKKKLDNYTSLGRPIDGYRLFWKHNLMGLYRGVMNEPRLDISLDYVPPAPPILTDYKISSDTLTIFWHDYKPYESSCSTYKNASLFVTVHCDYFVRILKKHFENDTALLKYLPTVSVRTDSDFIYFSTCGKIISVQPVPSEQKLDIRYLILKYGALLPLKYVFNCRFRFQMDTLLLMDNVVPEVSSLSNVLDIYWTSEEANQQSRQAITHIKDVLVGQPIERKPIVFKKSSKGTFEPGTGKYIIDEI
ncbi:MAG: hypothetical protein ACK4NF_05160 [Planctomycetota bacterium]